MCSLTTLMATLTALIMGAIKYVINCIVGLDLYNNKLSFSI